MRQALASSLADVHTRHELVDVRFPAPGVALANCVKHVSDERDAAAGGDGGWRSPTAATSRSRSSSTDGRWLIALAQTTPITVSVAPRGHRRNRLVAVKHLAPR